MKVDRWEEYQAFFQLIILRYLIVWFSLVPVIAGLVTQLPDPLPVTIMNVTHDIELVLPFHWQLLWLSSLFFVIALAIYKVFCPKFIHKYNNFSDYCKYKHHPKNQRGQILTSDIKKNQRGQILTSDIKGLDL